MRARDNLPSLIAASFRTRLGRRLAAAIFLCVLAIEGLVLIPSAGRHEEELNARLEAAGLAALRAALAAAGPEALADRLEPLRGGPVAGLILYDRDGGTAATFGTAPVHTPQAARETGTMRRASGDGRWLDAVWTAGATGLPLTAAARLDAERVSAERDAYLLRLGGLVLVASLGVAGAAMLVVTALVLSPLMRLTAQIGSAQPGEAAFAGPGPGGQREDELGEAARGAAALAARAAEADARLRGAQAALDAAREELEAKVEERTRELLDSNEKLTQQIEERERAEAQLRHDAFHDRLTGLPNRSLIIDRIDHAIRRLRRTPDRHFGLLLLNIDRFKVVNDSLGHLAGDELLKIVANRFSDTLRPGDTIARTGGDEFAILVEDVRAMDSAVACANRIRTVLTEPVVIDAQEIYLSFSVGLAVSNRGYIRAESMMQDAAIALSHAKVQGKSHVMLFESWMRSGSAGLLKVESDLRRAVGKGDELLLHYQPVIALASGRIAGFEALVRWQHPERGLVSPAEFIPLAEDTGLIVPIGRWVLKEALRQTSVWRKLFPDSPPLIVGVNVSPRQLSEGGFAEEVAAALQEAEAEPACLKLELTESVLMQNPELAASVLAALKRLDVRLSIDDFGTGYSSLGYLRRFPFDELKIDRSFIRAISEGRESREIVRTIVELARVLRMDVVAEGTETAEEVECMRSLGCDFVQGFFFAQPMIAAEAERLIIKNRQGWQFESRAAPVRTAGPARLIAAG